MDLLRPAASPISKLHDDILWSIFHLNSHPFEYDSQGIGPEEISSLLEEPSSEPPLVNNRRASQVCRQWRRVIIHSPSIWASGSELEYLDQRRNEWRNEVLKRTGNAPLTVIGQVGKDPVWLFDINRHAIPFTLTLLDGHWDRIRTLIIHSYDAAVDEQLQIASRRPAPNLEKLIIALHQNRVGDDAIPFMNHAPRLRTLSTHGLPFNFSQPSWTSNIRHLNLSWSQRDISIPQLLHGLGNMTYLETICLCDLTPGSDSDIVRRTTIASTTPTIIFSSLKNFTIQEASNSAAPYLITHIIVPPRCIVNVETNFNEFDTEVPEHIALCYAKFLKNNFPPSDVTDICYSLQNAKISSLEYEVFGDERDPDATSRLDISIGGSIESRYRYFQYTSGLVGVSNTPFRMAEALSSYDLGNVTTLTLRLHVHSHDNVLEHPLFDSMYDFFLALESVETLHTDDETLMFYMRSEVLWDADVLFPRLVTVSTDLWDVGIASFLAYRHDIYDEESEDGITRIKRLVFRKNSPVPYGDPSIVGAATAIGLVVEWVGREISDGVLAR